MVFIDSSVVAAVPAAIYGLGQCRRDACRHSECAVLSEQRRSVRANARGQFNKRRFSRRTGIERDPRERDFRRRQNYKFGEGKIDNRRGETFCWSGRDCAENFTTFGRPRLRFCRLGMKRTAALGRLRFCGKRAERAVIRQREPGGDCDRDDQATRNCSHTDSIADGTRLLKCFLFRQSEIRRARRSRDLAASAECRPIAGIQAAGPA
jgi:hypothetical protein